ncbi:hypothetical protein ACIRF8_35820 [Streptomyces sp. NPDC102406]|uniref:hypothetical protein n=1 Tax=Streptomyces sp. NPDC102406 TaxID=3366171 RepID=UPI0037FE3234
MRTTALAALASGRWELVDAAWQGTDLLLWKPPAAWFSINAFFVPDSRGGRRLRNGQPADDAPPNYADNHAALALLHALRK